MGDPKISETFHSFLAKARIGSDTPLSNISSGNISCDSELYPLDTKGICNHLFEKKTSYEVSLLQLKQYLRCNFETTSSYNVTF